MVESALGRDEVHKSALDTDSREPFKSHLLILIAIIVTVIVLLSTMPSGIFSSNRILTFSTADDHVRLARVLDLVQGRVGWFDNSLHWSNSPFGTTIHWTRPLDVVIALLSAPFSLFVSWKDAIAIGGILLAPVLYALFLSTLWWAGRQYLSSGGASLAMIIAALQPMIINYGAIGRTDHHIALLTIFVALFGCGIRAISAPSTPLAFVAGVIGALGIWISQEAIFGIALLGGAWLITWILVGTHARELFIFNTSWCCGLLVATFFEHGPSHWFRVEYDRVSLPHVLLTFSGLVASAIVLTLNGSLFARTKWRRLLIAVASSLIFIALAKIADVDFYKLLTAPNSVIPEDVRTQWLEKLSEFNSLWELTPSRAVGYLSVPLVSLCLLSYQAFRSRSAVSITALIWQVSAIAAGVIALRSIIYAEAIGAIGLAGGVWSWLRRFSGEERVQFLARPLTVLFAALGPYVFAAFVSPLNPVKDEVRDRGCGTRQLINELETRVINPETASGRPTAVLTQLDLAALIHLGSGVDVVATGHHPNVEGIRSVRDLFRSPADISRVEIERRFIRYVVICEAIGDQFMTPIPVDSLYNALVTDKPPPWLREVSVGNSGSRIFEVTP